MKKSICPPAASNLYNTLCICLTVVVFAYVLYPFLQYRQAIQCLNDANIQYTASSCIEVDRASKTGSKGGSSCFYRLQLDDGMELRTIIGGNVDVSLQTYETLKTEFENAQCFNYVTVTVFGIEEHWLLSAQSENKELLSEDGLLQKLETEKQKRLLAVWLCAGLFAPVVAGSIASMTAKKGRKSR